jgi:hypothetical protein|mmetsp:Transcript_9100/g.38543  ORF Transcript_9100/g.38543 Transcript_9100/m.38543 type:complete len:222 (+) Transcript_9100:1125-1790(+)
MVAARRKSGVALTAGAAGDNASGALGAGMTGDNTNGADHVGVTAHATGSAGGRAAEGTSYAGVLVHGTGSASDRAGGAGGASAAVLRDTGSAGDRTGSAGGASAAKLLSGSARGEAETPDAGEAGAEADTDQVGVGFGSHAGDTCACGQADCFAVRALLDSGANPIVSGDPSLFESFGRRSKLGTPSRARATEYTTKRSKTSRSPALYTVKPRQKAALFFR